MEKLISDKEIETLNYMKDSDMHRVLERLATVLKTSNVRAVSTSKNWKKKMSKPMEAIVAYNLASGSVPLYDVSDFKFHLVLFFKWSGEAIVSQSSQDVCVINTRSLKNALPLYFVKHCKVTIEEVMIDE